MYVFNKKSAVILLKDAYKPVEVKAACQAEGTQRHGAHRCSL